MLNEIPPPPLLLLITTYLPPHALHTLTQTTPILPNHLKSLSDAKRYETVVVTSRTPGVKTVLDDGGCAVCQYDVLMNEDAFRQLVGRHWWATLSEEDHVIRY